MCSSCLLLRRRASAAAADELDLAFWNSVKDSHRCEELQAYLDQHSHRPLCRFGPSPAIVAGSDLAAVPYFCGCRRCGTPTVFRSRAEPNVRIHLPPGQSPVRTSSTNFHQASIDGAMRRVLYRSRDRPRCIRLVLDKG